MKKNRVFVLGGTGFVGHHLIHRLSRAGMQCRVATRHPQRHRDLSLVPGCEVLGVADYGVETLTAGMSDCGAAINLAGILNEVRGRTFEQCHVALVEAATAAAVRAGVPRFVQMSALNADADTAPSQYLRSKGRGEEIAHAAADRGLAVTSLRPSVIFGLGDSLFNRFAALLRVAPGVFPLACADARFAPVYVGDVAEAIVRSLSDPDTIGKRIELCGPRVFTLRDLVSYTGTQIGRSVRVVGLSDRMARWQARILEKFPGAPFSMDNYLSLQRDAVCQAEGMSALGIQPTDIDVVVPGYLR